MFAGHSLCYIKCNKQDYGGRKVDFVFLGTGAGVPAKTRNVTSIALQLLEERGNMAIRLW